LGHDHQGVKVSTDLANVNSLVALMTPVIAGVNDPSLCLVNSNKNLDLKLFVNVIFLTKGNTMQVVKTQLTNDEKSVQH
jgi:hypothetical protein